MKIKTKIRLFKGFLAALVGATIFPKAAFGLFDYTMIPKLRRLLRVFNANPYGLSSDRNNWGDQVEVTVEPIIQPNINLGSAYLSEVLKELDRNNARNRDAGEDPHNYAKGC